MHIGTCALCRTAKTELRRSHILSRFGYRRLREISGTNPNPMHITPARAVQSSTQIAEYLLCGNCEQLLGNDCEAYVAILAYQANGDCCLYDLLEHTSAVVQESITDSGERDVVQCDSLNVPLLIDFAVSIFWRTAIAQHIDTNGFYLSSDLLERLRLYLFNHTNDISDLSIALQVIDQPRNLENNRFDQIISVPATVDNGDYRMHGFLFNGLYFTMAEGQNVPPEFRLTCLQRTPPSLSFTKAVNIQFIHRIVELVNTATPST